MRRAENTSRPVRSSGAYTAALEPANSAVE